MSEEDISESEYQVQTEDEEEVDDPGTSTSRRTYGKQANAAKKKRKKSLLVNCNLCGRPYRTMEGYRKHLSMHVVEDLLQNTPGCTAVRDECRREYVHVLQDMQVLKPLCGFTESIFSIAVKLQELPIEKANILVNRVAEELWSCLPDPSVTDIQKFHLADNVHIVLTEKGPALVNVLKSVLDPVEFPEKALDWFCTDFLRRLSIKVESFFHCCLNEPSNTLLCSSEEDRDNPADINFQQSLHYIGGSTVKSVMRKSWKYLTNPSWKSIYECMSSKFVVGEGLIGPGDDVELWTSSMDRGGLKRINHKIWSFVLALSGVLKKKEGEDGSILHENVFKIVTSDDVLMFLWNDITQNSLTEEIDILLLHNFCKFFTNTWLQGVILRRKNAVPKISRDKVPLRSRLSN